MIRARRARIVATLGPASREASKVIELATAGADVFRVNFSHGTHADHAATIANVRAAEAAAAGQPTLALRLVVGARLVFSDGTPDIIAYPATRYGWGRLTQFIGNAPSWEKACEKQQYRRGR